MTIAWEELGDVTEPGTYTIDGVGEVTVCEVDLTNLVRFGRDSFIELVDSSPGVDETRRYRIARFIPK